MSNLNVLFRSAKTSSHKAWMKKHNFCYVKKIETRDDTWVMKAKHCSDHNEFFILSLTDTAKGE